MNRLKHGVLLIAAGCALLLTGCGRPAAATAAAPDHEDHAGHGEEEGEASGVSHHEGRGLELAPEVVGALGLRLAEVEERTFAVDFRVSAQVIATTPQRLAVARVPLAEAETLRAAVFTDASLVRMDPAPASSTGLADLVLALGTEGASRLGDFVEIPVKGEATGALTVPRSAILDAASGTFVYVVNGGAYLRTAVTLGAMGRESVQVVDGLYAGDVVVAAPVEALWLAELRLTKGGGHSH